MFLPFVMHFGGGMDQSPVSRHSASSLPTMRKSLEQWNLAFAINCSTCTVVLPLRGTSAFPHNMSVSLSDTSPVQLAEKRERERGKKKAFIKQTLHLCLWC